MILESEFKFSLFLFIQDGDTGPDSTGVKGLALHMTDPGSASINILGILLSSPSGNADSVSDMGDALSQQRLQWLLEMVVVEL